MAPPASDVSVLIPAAGLGERLGRGAKALLPLDGRPMLDWVVDKAAQLGSETLVAMPAGVAAPTGCTTVPGGPTRQESVRRLGLAATRPWVLVWDAARPFGSLALARAVLAAAGESGVAAATEPADPSRPFQTPLAFARPVLARVVALAHAEGWEAASTMALVLRAGLQPSPVPGEASNLKLTTAGDWERAQALLHLLRI